MRLRIVMSVVACATLIAAVDEVAFLAHCFEAIDRSLGQAVPPEEVAAMLLQVEEAKAPGNTLSVVQHDDKLFLEAWFVGEDKENLKRLVEGKPSEFKRYVRNQFGWRGTRLEKAQTFIAQLVRGKTVDDATDGSDAYSMAGELDDIGNLSDVTE